MKKLNKESRDRLKEVIKQHYKSGVLKEKEDSEEELDINDEETDGVEDDSVEGSEEVTSGGNSSEIENALNAALEAAASYGDPKLSTLLNNAKIYLARSLSKKV